MVYDDSRTRGKNRKKIVDVAKKLFIENGIAHTTIIDIVKETEMERKTFYNYFVDKEEISDYIYFQSMIKFYGHGFSADVYEDCKNGYEKIEKYLKSIVDRYVEYSHDMLFLVHYDYYFKKTISEETIASIYEEVSFQRPEKYFVEGVNDGSIIIDGDNPLNAFNVISQSLGSYASRLIFRGYRNGVEKVTLDFSTLYDLLDILLKSIKK